MKKTAILTLFVALTSQLVLAQTYKESKANFRTTLNDTTCMANSKKAFAMLDYTTGKMVISIKPKTFKTGNTRKDSLLKSFFDSEILLNIDGEDWFAIESKVNMHKWTTYTGLITVNGNTKEVTVKCKYSNIQSSGNDTSRNTDELPLRMSLIMSFDPSSLVEIEGLSKMVDIEMEEAYLNRKN